MKTVQGLFVVSAAFLLLLTASGKLVGLIGGAAALSAVDPIFGVSLRSLFLGAIICEIIVGGYCLRARDTFLAVKGILSLSAVFFLYRLGAWWLDYHGPCSCLGSLTGALKLSGATADAIAKAILVYLLVGSLTITVSRYYLNRPSATAPKIQAT